MSQFEYLAEKIEASDFSNTPFKHITIANFFQDDHFSRIVKSKDVLLPICKSNKELLDRLVEKNYLPQEFPGCIVDTEVYLNYLEGIQEFQRDLVVGYGRDVIDGYGITMRLQTYQDRFLSELMAYLNSAPFLEAIKSKFSIDAPVNIETAVQKNLNKYEISPHCDTSRKALTYMINIYTDQACEELSIHTHLMRFLKKHQYLYSFWEDNSDVDPVWVPWDWCETVKKTNANNSICIFKPSFDTLHAVKLDYNHLLYQRNQIYGNLWYPKSLAERSISWQDLDLVSVKKPVKRSLRGYYHRLKRKLRP